MKLYVYDHCPYCVKARMIFGFKNIPFELVTLLNDDEETPIRMIGAKMVPILEHAPNTYMPESMDIIRFVDASDHAPVLTGAQNDAIAAWLSESRDYVYKLAMPRWVEAPLEEFATPSAQAYFTRKKEAMIGAFDEQMARSADYIAQANAHLHALAPLITSPQAVNGTLSDDDIHLFATLRSLSIVKGIDWPDTVDAYRHHIADASGIPLHDDIAI